MSETKWAIQTNAHGTFDVLSTTGSSSYIVADDLPIEDAAMIAAAPALYEALVRLEGIVRIFPPDMDAPGSALEQARAALAAARGEKP